MPGVETVDLSPSPVPNPNEPTRSRISRVLSDIHFWIPVAVLLAGLLLLGFFH